MAVEIERKFLVRGEFKSMSSSCSHIVQGYLAKQNGQTVRVRIRDKKGFLTIKGPSCSQGLSRYEFECEIAKSDAEDLIRLCQNGLVEKRRYLVPYAHHIYEVDEFLGENKGLIVAEIELDHEDEPFEKPDFIGEEVTGQARYYNSHLLSMPYSQWPESDKHV